MFVGCSTRCSTPTSTSASLSLDDTNHRAVQAFRQNVLTPCRIRVYDAPSKQTLPQRLLRLIEDLSQNLTQFDYQLGIFKDKLSSTYDFSCANLLSTDLLPTFSYETRLSRSLGPLFSRQALPRQDYKAEVRSHAPSILRASFACGFSRSAFSLRELSSIPPSLTCQGIIEDNMTSPTSPINTTFYGSFLTFQQAHGSSETGFDAARHQCAINGACNVRALQIVSDMANQTGTPLLSQTFSCCVNRESAVINHHWIDKHQNYCMAPICRFELTKDDHIRLLMAWVGAIERWAVIELLPQIKGALARIPEMMLSPPSTPEYQPAATIRPSLPTDGKYSQLMYSLKTRIEALPCHLDNAEDDENNSLSLDGDFDRKSCSSATASWNSFTPTLLALPKLPVANPSKETEQPAANKLKTRLDRQNSLDLLRQRRINHAMNEVYEIETQLRNVRKETRGLIRSLQNEMVRLKQVHEALEVELVGAKKRVSAIEDELVCQAATPPFSEPTVVLPKESVEAPHNNLSVQMRRTVHIPIRPRAENPHAVQANLVPVQTLCHKERVLPTIDITSSYLGQSTYSSDCPTDLSPPRRHKPIQTHRLPRLETILPASILRDTIPDPIQTYPSNAILRNLPSVSVPVPQTSAFAVPTSTAVYLLHAPTPPQTQEIPYPTISPPNPIDAEALIERLLMLPPTPLISTPPSPATTISSECFNDNNDFHRPVYFGLGIDIPELDCMESATAELLSVYSDDEDVNEKHTIKDTTDIEIAKGAPTPLAYFIAIFATCLLFDHFSFLAFTARTLVFVFLLKALTSLGYTTR